MRPDFDFNAGLQMECPRCLRWHDGPDFECWECRRVANRRGEALYLVATVVCVTWVVWMFAPWLLECVRLWFGLE